MRMNNDKRGKDIIEDLLKFFMMPSAVDCEMSKIIIIKRTGQAPLRVRGETIISTGTSMESTASDYSGIPGYAMDVRLIRTAAGNYVAAVRHRRIWQGVHASDDADVFPTLRQCMDYLGDRIPGWLLSEIVEELDEEITEASACPDWGSP